MRRLTVVLITFVLITFLLHPLQISAFWFKDRETTEKGSVFERFRLWVQSVKKHPSNERITLFKDPGGRVDWSGKTDKIAFDKRGSDDFYDVYISDSDGSDERCLTCNNPELSKHNGNPVFTPDGAYIIFQAQSKNSPLGDYLATPGKGIYNNLWLMDSLGKNFWQLTDINSPNAYGVLHPRVSHSGDKLFWSQRAAGGNGIMGIWALKIADLQTNPPRLTNIRTYQPGKDPKFYESHGFSLDDSRIIYSGNPDGQSDKGFDIYTMDLNTGQTTNLTNTPEVWDEHSQFFDNDSKIIWVSSQDNRLLKLDLWTMDADGSNKKELLALPHTIADNSFSPDGKKIIFYLIDDLKESNGKNYLFDLKSN